MEAESKRCLFCTACDLHEAARASLRSIDSFGGDSGHGTGRIVDLQVVVSLPLLCPNESPCTRIPIVLLSVVYLLWAALRSS